MQYRLRQGRPTTKRFFATVQNKLYSAVHDHTVVEIIQSCARANQPHMGLISWAGSPDGKILPSNVTIGKNYLTRDDLDLGRLVMPSSISMIAKSSTAQAASLRPKSTHALSESEKFHIIQAQEYVSGARVCQGNGVSGSIACEGRRSHDDRGNSE